MINKLQAGRRYQRTSNTNYSSKKIQIYKIQNYRLYKGLLHIFFFLLHPKIGLVLRRWLLQKPLSGWGHSWHLALYGDPSHRGLQGPGCHSSPQGTSGSPGSHSVRSPGGEEHGSQIFAKENQDHLESFTLKSLGSNHPLLLQTRGCGVDTLRNGSKNKRSGHYAVNVKGQFWKIKYRNIFKVIYLFPSSLSPPFRYYFFPT